MRIRFDWQDKSYEADLSKGLDLSIPLRNGSENPNAWWAAEVKFEAVRMGDFIGSTLEGGSVNYKNVFFNPHGNGTHTECVGHISKDGETIHQCLKNFHCMAQLLTIELQQQDGDWIIPAEEFPSIHPNVEALIIRSLPNSDVKLRMIYSGHNPPYFSIEAMQRISDAGIVHLITDLPSVDREQDGGKLAAHNLFWQTHKQVRRQATITEMAYVREEIKDGIYLLNLQIPSFELDAAPSKPVLYVIEEMSASAK